MINANYGDFRFEGGCLLQLYFHWIPINIPFKPPRNLFSPRALACAQESLVFLRDFLTYFYEVFFRL